MFCALSIIIRIPPINLWWSEPLIPFSLQSTIKIVCDALWGRRGKQLRVTRLVIIRSITLSDPSQYQIHQISDPSEYQIHHNIRSTTISDPSNIRSTTISDPSNIRSITISDLSQPTYSMLTSSISIRRNCLSLLDGAEPGLAMGNRNLISNFLNPRSNKNDMTSKGPIFSVWWVLYIAL